MSLYEIEAEYYYENPKGEAALKVLRAIRNSGKKQFWQYHKVGNEWKKGGYTGPLAPFKYFEWKDKKTVLIHVEGEKKALRLMQEGFAVTTTPGGANNWKKSFAPFYADRDVIILPDNNNVGRDYALNVAKDICRIASSVKIVELPHLVDGEDVYDWLERGGTKKTLLEICERAEVFDVTRLNATENENTTSEIEDDPDEEDGGPNADDYFIFFEDLLNRPQKDILTGELMTKHDELWQPAQSRLDVLGAYAYESGFYCKSHLKEYLAMFTESKTPKFLASCPDWDGRDRVLEIVNSIEIENCSNNIFYELLCDWGAKIFRRIENPRVQNRLLVLQGDQGIGKDRLVTEMIGGLGQFTADLTFSQNEKDTIAAATFLAVARISEFDRTAKTEVSMLKDLITRESSFIRLPYDRSPKLRPMRCSFVATVNVEDILRDHTGNRRFLIFNIKKINWNYPMGQSDQILAQFRHLAMSDYKSSNDAELVMKKYLAKHTPEDPKIAVLKIFDDRMRLANKLKNEHSLNDILEIVEGIAKAFNMPTKNVLHLLKINGRSKRKNSGMVYFAQTVNEGEGDCGDGSRT